MALFFSGGIKSVFVFIGLVYHKSEAWYTKARLMEIQYELHLEKNEKLQKACGFCPQMKVCTFEEV